MSTKFDYRNRSENPNTSKKNTMKLILYMFISLSSNGDNIGTTDYVVYQKENVLTLEVL